MEGHWQALCIAAHFLINFCSQISPDCCEFDKKEVWLCKIMSIQKKKKKKENQGKEEIKISTEVVRKSEQKLSSGY